MPHQFEVGELVSYQYAAGKYVPAVIVEYQAGKDAGDYRLGGFTNSDQKADGAGDVFNLWSTPGSKQGNFKTHD